MTGPQETETDEIAPLEPAVVIRLRELINEIIDTDRALERLLSSHREWEDIAHPVEILRKSMHARLCGSMNLLYGGAEDQ